MDDTILRKTGRLIPGAAYRKDPLGPAFNLNLVWAQRMVQFSAALPNANGEVRMIPIDFVEASTPRKPRKNEPPETWEAYKETLRHGPPAGGHPCHTPQRPRRFLTCTGAVGVVLKQALPKCCIKSKKRWLPDD